VNIFSGRPRRFVVPIKKLLNQPFFYPVFEKLNRQ